MWFVGGSSGGSCGGKTGGSTQAQNLCATAFLMVLVAEVAVISTPFIYFYSPLSTVFYFYFFLRLKKTATTAT